MLDELPLHGVRDRVLILRSFPNFAPIDDDAIAALAEHARLRRVRAGETLLRQGEIVDRAFMVVSGVLRVTRKGKHVALVKRARGAGLLSVLAQDDEGVDCVVEEDAVVLEMSSASILDAAREYPSLARNFIRFTARGLLEKRKDLPANPEKPPPVEMGAYRERPATLAERILTMGGTGLFARGNIDAVLEIARRLIEVRAKPGDVVLRRGEPATSWIRLVYGQVRCTNEAGVSVDVGANFIVGALNAFGSQPRSFDVVAVTDVIGMVLQLDAFFSVLETHPDMALMLLRSLCKTLLDS